MRIQDDQVLREISQILKAMGDPTRLRLLQEMLDGERRAGDLVAAVGTSQANISKHLTRLRGAGLVEARREGANVVYRIAAPFVREVCGTLCRGLEERLSDDGDLRRRVKRILRASGEVTS